MRPYAVHAGLELELQMEEKRTYRQNREQKPQRGERKKEFPKREREEAPENMLEGRNAVTEALSAGRTIDKLFVADGDTDRALGRICAMAKQAGAVVVPTDRRKLDYMSATGAHQGVIAMVAAHDYASIDDILKKAQDAGEPPLIVICDELSDPHNLGAIIRTAECAGAHGIIIPKRRSVGLTAVVGKASAGALEYMRSRAFPTSQRPSIRSKRRACGSTVRRRRAIRRSIRQTSKALPPSSSATRARA